MATSSLTILALIAFAGNSIFCRLAFGEAAIDPLSYTIVRLVSGALTLWLVTRFCGTRPARPALSGSWIGASLLFLYAIAFSFAYLNLSAGSGALILFAAVQFSMIAAGLRSGERPLIGEWLGWTAAIGGLIYLLLPGAAAPSLGGSFLMAVAGVAWGIYSLLGRGVSDPVQTTTGNFLRTLPLVSIVGLVQLPSLDWSAMGLLWAGLSGAVTSALGYVCWYAAIPRLTATRAATLQLSVPVIAAIGGVLLLAEEVTVRLLLAAGAILGGIGLSMLARALSKGLSFAGKFIRGGDADLA